MVVGVVLVAYFRGNEVTTPGPAAGEGGGDSAALPPIPPLSQPAPMFSSPVLADVAIGQAPNATAVIRELFAAVGPEAKPEGDGVRGNQEPPTRTNG